MSNSSKLSAAALGIVASVSVYASAATSLVYGPTDTRGTSISANDNFSNDGDGSRHLQTFGSTGLDKTDVVFAKSDGTSLGVLGSLTLFSTDFYKSLTGNTTAADASFAYRLFTNAGMTEGLVWENQWNGSGTVPTNAWTTNDMTAGTFWARKGGANYNVNGGPQTLAEWASGNATLGVSFSASTPIYGVQISYGSATPGTINGYIDNVQLNFSTGESYVGNVVPEPASLGLLAIGSLTLLRRRR